ncbi:hypothetical protein PC115_g22604 [Phytophthora cactorum]|uniref:Uncharacterized protein n=2 Tax=Phytophthora cactorum TaxID=29920 RepID=A0A8T1AIH0_9STRA|nr:hypothetical protein PC115_g22604 [Phytophthora cactorum]
MMSLGHGVSAHMPLGAGGLAYIAQGLRSFAAEGDFVLMVTGTVLPPRPVQLRQDDVKRVEPHKDAFSVTSRSSRDVKPKMTSRRGDHDPSPGDSGSSKHDARSRRRCERNSVRSHHSSNSRFLSVSSRHSRMRSSRSFSATSGRGQLQPNALWQHQEWQVRIEEEHGDWKAGSRAQELEKASKPQDSVKLEAVRQDAPAPDAAETVSVEHARLESLFTEKRQSREAESDAMRAQWPQDMMESWRHEKLALELRIIDAEAEQDHNSEASKII